MNHLIRENKETVNFVRVIFNVNALTISAVKNLGFLFRAWLYLSSSKFYTYSLFLAHMAQPRVLFSHMGAAPPTMPHLLESIQEKATILIIDSALSSKLLPFTQQPAIFSWTILQFFEVDIIWSVYIPGVPFYLQKEITLLNKTFFSLNFLSIYTTLSILTSVYC